jgi:hypothetical protein
MTGRWRLSGLRGNDSIASHGSWMAGAPAIVPAMMSDPTPPGCVCGQAEAGR